MATGQWNDFGESFFGLLRPPARIRPSRKNADGDVCRSQSPLTFSGKRKLSADKSYARAASAPVAWAHGVVWGCRTDGEASLLLVIYRLGVRARIWIGDAR